MTSSRARVPGSETASGEAASFEGEISPGGQRASRASHAPLAVLVPLKPFTLAKSRLGSSFDPEARARIAERLARRVLRAAASAFPDATLYVVASSALADFAASNAAELL